LSEQYHEIEYQLQLIPKTSEFLHKLKHFIEDISATQSEKDLLAEQINNCFNFLEHYYVQFEEKDIEAQIYIHIIPGTFSQKVLEAE
jgi:hypothetical protein